MVSLLHLPYFCQLLPTFLGLDSLYELTASSEHVKSRREVQDSEYGRGRALPYHESLGSRFSNFKNSNLQNVQMMLIAHYVQYLFVSRDHIGMYMYSKAHFMVCMY